MSIWKRPIGKDCSDLSDALSGDPADSFWTKWFGGVIFPLLPLWGAIACWVTKTGFIPGRSCSRFELSGLQAVVLGWLLFAIAGFIHVHCFWGNSKRLYDFMDFGKTIFGLITVGCILYLYWFMGVEIFGN